MFQVAVDPLMGFTRQKLSGFDLAPYPDWGFLKNVILKNVKNIRKLFLTEWMAEVTLNVGDEEKQDLREHIKNYFTCSAGFNLVSCDRYSKEGHQGSKVLATKACSKGRKVSGLVGTTSPITEDQERELALRGVDTSCILKSSRSQKMAYLGGIAYPHT